jgi:ABC-type dipeptide/oligopeptide/nickel transport system ATPase subunit
MANVNDQRRKDAVIKALEKAKEKAQTAHLYLVANARTMEEIADMTLVLEHIDIAIAAL